MFALRGQACRSSDPCNLCLPAWTRAGQHLAIRACCCPARRPAPVHSRTSPATQPLDRAPAPSIPGPPKHASHTRLPCSPPPTSPRSASPFRATWPGRPARLTSASLTAPATQTTSADWPACCRCGAMLCGCDAVRCYAGAMLCGVVRCGVVWLQPAAASWARAGTHRWGTAIERQFCVAGRLQHRG